MSKHTPGPWRLNPELLPYPKSDQGVMTSRKYIADIASGTRNMPEGTTPEEALANARLVCAAPDMLATLKRVLPCMVEVERRAGTNGSLCDAIRAAIAKAEG